MEGLRWANCNIAIPQTGSFRGLLCLDCKGWNWSFTATLFRDFWDLIKSWKVLHYAIIYKMGQELPLQFGLVSWDRILASDSVCLTSRLYCCRTHKRYIQTDTNVAYTIPGMVDAVVPPWCRGLTNEQAQGLVYLFSQRWSLKFFNSLLLQIENSISGESNSSSKQLPTIYVISSF